MTGESIIMPAWDRGSAEREAIGMFGNSALHRAAAAIGGSHPRALDYLRQAPVIVLSATSGLNGMRSGRQIQSYAGPPMRLMCERGDRLRDVMAYYGCGQQLRRLVPSVLHPVRWPIIRQLGKMPPSTLAQVIPAKRSAQDVWLRSLYKWSEQCRHRCENPWFLFDWAACALIQVVRTEEDDAAVVADLAIEAARETPRAGAIFDQRWTFRQARAATDRWHRAMGRRRDEAKTAAQLGIGFSDPIDYAPFPNEPVIIGDLTFVPLRSCEDLWVEGVAMRHCVAAYSADVVHGASRIISVQKDGRRIATAEWRFQQDGGPSATGPYVLRQLKGPCNARVTNAVVQGVSAFAASVRTRPAKPAGLRGAFPEVTATFSDEAAA